MEKLKNILQEIIIVLIILMLSFLGYKTVYAVGKDKGYAVKYKDGKKITLTVDEYTTGDTYKVRGWNDLGDMGNGYCVDHGGKLLANGEHIVKGEFKPYVFRVMNTITIDGLYAENNREVYEYPIVDEDTGELIKYKVSEKGNAESTSKYNAMLAYIVANGTGYGEWKKDGSGYTDSQLAVYTVWNNFAKKIGLDSWTNKDNDKERHTDLDIYKKAVEYAEKLKDKKDLELKDKTEIADKSRVKAELVKYSKDELCVISREYGSSDKFTFFTIK